LVSTLHLGDEVVDIIQKEVDAAEEASRKAREAEEAEAAAAEGTDSGSADTGTEDSGEAEIDLSPMPDSEIAEEGFMADDSKTILVEDGVLIEDTDELPTPEEADIGRDFTENL
jgi:hypothetical protein